jgi:hypothetical protein
VNGVENRLRVWFGSEFVKIKKMAIEASFYLGKVGHVVGRIIVGAGEKVIFGGIKKIVEEGR